MIITQLSNIDIKYQAILKMKIDKLVHELLSLVDHIHIHIHMNELDFPLLAYWCTPSVET